MNYMPYTLAAINSIRKCCQGKFHFLIFVNANEDEVNSLIGATNEITYTVNRAAN
jgi:hypothetical protein